MYKDWLMPLGLGALLALVLGAIVMWADRKLNRPAEIWHGSVLLASIHPLFHHRMRRNSLKQLRERRPIERICSANRLCRFVFSRGSQSRFVLMSDERAST